MILKETSLSTLHKIIYHKNFLLISFDLFLRSITWSFAHIHMTNKTHEKGQVLFDTSVTSSTLLIFMY